MYCCVVLSFVIGRRKLEFEEEETMVRRKKKRGRKIEKEKEAIEEEEGKRVEKFVGWKIRMEVEEGRCRLWFAAV